MKVLFLTNIPSPYRVDFFNELGTKCDLTVLFEKKKSIHRNDEWLSNPINSFEAVFLDIEKKENKGGRFSFLRYFDNKEYDVIVIGGYSTSIGITAIEYCRLKKIPFVLNTDGGLINLDNKLKYNLKKHLVGSASWWLTTGSSTTAYLIHYGANKNYIYHYPFTSVKNEDIKPIMSDQKKILKEKLGLPNKKTVISVGQLIDRKGFDLLIKAWRKTSPEINLIIIGQGEKKDELNKLIIEYELKNVQIIDFMSPEDLSLYYQASDLFVLLTREDIWGLVINEAMSYGLPVITTDRCVAGMELIINGNNGYVIKLEEFDSVHIAVASILDNPDFHEKISQNNINKIKEYTIEKMADAHINIFKSINYQSELNNFYIYE